MLAVRKDVIHLQMFHHMAMDYVFIGCFLDAIQVKEIGL